MRKKYRYDIDKNKKKIRSIAGFLHNLTQLFATPMSVGVPQLEICSRHRKAP